jgi:hypothetical protein
VEYIDKLDNNLLQTFFEWNEKEMLHKIVPFLKYKMRMFLKKEKEYSTKTILSVFESTIKKHINEESLKDKKGNITIKECAFILKTITNKIISNHKSFLIGNHYKSDFENFSLNYFLKDKYSKEFLENPEIKNNPEFKGKQNFRTNYRKRTGRVLNQKKLSKIFRLLEECEMLKIVRKYKKPSIFYLGDKNPYDIHGTLLEITKSKWNEL